MFFYHFLPLYSTGAPTHRKIFTLLALSSFTGKDMIIVKSFNRLLPLDIPIPFKYSGKIRQLVIIAFPYTTIRKDAIEICIIRIAKAMRHQIMRNILRITEFN